MSHQGIQSLVNTHQYWDNKDLLENLNKFRDLILAEEIVIIGMQEIWVDNVSYLAKELNMYYFTNTITQENTFHGIALLSKYPMLESNSLVLNDTALNGELIETTIKYANENITVYVTHLDTPTNYIAQLNEVKQILKITKNKPNTLLLCDCNAPDTIFLESYRLLTEQFEDGWIASGKSTFEGRTWPSNSPFLRVDYVWLSKEGWSVLKGSGRTFGTTGDSDHLGVKVTIALQ